MEKETKAYEGTWEKKNITNENDPLKEQWELLKNNPETGEKERLVSIIIIPKFKDSLVFEVLDTINPGELASEDGTRFYSSVEGLKEYFDERNIGLRPAYRAAAKRYGIALTRAQT